MTQLNEAVRNFNENFLKQFIDEYSSYKNGESILKRDTDIELSQDAKDHLEAFRNTIEEEIGEASGEWKNIKDLISENSNIDKFSKTTEGETIQQIFESLKFSDIPPEEQMDEAQEIGQSDYNDLKGDALHDIKSLIALLEELDYSVL